VTGWAGAVATGVAVASFVLGVGVAFGRGESVTLGVALVVAVFVGSTATFCCDGNLASGNAHNKTTVPTSKANTVQAIAREKYRRFFPGGKIFFDS